MEEKKAPATSGRAGSASPTPCRSLATANSGSKLNILAAEPIKRLFRWRGFQFALQGPNVVIYILVILTGFYGTQVGSQNFATVLTWTVWWSAIIFTFLFAGRLWCLMCPFAAMAEWLQRLTLWTVKRETFGFNWKWPLKLRNVYLATLTFLILTWADHQFGLVHNPLYTAYLVLIILTVAVLVALLFERRTFCRFVCPIGGLIGTYSLFAGSELRVADPQVCREHKEKSCLLGRGKLGYGCPVLEYPGTMTSNYSCTLCTECVKTCPKDNIVFNLRPVAHDLVNLSERRLRPDMAILAMILLGLPTLQTIVMITPWESWMQAVADLTRLPSAIVFGGVFLLGALAIPLGLFSLTTRVSALLAGGEEVSQRRLFLNFAFAFVPIGLMMHLAHNTKHLFGEIQVAIPVVSDPFGWGWNLLGTAGLRLSPLVSDNLLTLLQFGLVVLGQGFAVYVGYKTCRRLFGADGKGFQRALVPMLVLMVAWSAFNLWVLNEPMTARH
jgi:polyferredoxin